MAWILQNRVCKQQTLFETSNLLFGCNIILLDNPYKSFHTIKLSNDSSWSFAVKKWNETATKNTYNSFNHYDSSNMKELTNC